MAEASSGFDIDVAGAADAMNSAGGVETLMANEREPINGPNPVPVAPSNDQPQQAQSQTFNRDEQGRFASATPEQPAQQPDAPADAGWSLNVDELPPEVQPLAKSLLGDYTRKTQEVAEQRRQFESFGSPEDIAAAIELRETLQDPNSWPQLHAELTQGLENMGYTFDQAQAMASDQLAQQGMNVQPQQPQQAQFDLSALEQDPELAPLKQYLDSTRSEVEQLRAEINAERERGRAEQLQMAVAGELTRQENAIRQANPNYTDEDINAIYELSSYHQGNLLQAQQRYEEDWNRRLNAYLQGKASPNAASTSASIPAGPITTQPREITTFDDADAAAQEHLRQLGLA